MAPPITPSPHRFLARGASSGRSRQDKEPQASHSERDSLQDLTGNTGPLYNTPTGSTSARRSSQFAAPPRFSSTGRTQPTQKPSYSPVSARRDRVEDYDGPTAGDANLANRSSVLDHSESRKHSEQIEDTVFENQNDMVIPIESNDAEQVMYDSMPTAKRRKVPLPEPWHGCTPATGAQGLPNDIYGPINVNVTTPDRIVRKAPIMISSPPRSKEDYIQPVSPKQFNSISPSTSSAKRKAPRFDFSGHRSGIDRVLTASSGLQRVVAAPQFILPPLSVDDDNNEEAEFANTNLALLFSPQKHKKYQYAPGGLAATVRDWVVGFAIGTSGSATQSVFRVLSIKPGQRGTQLVFGKDEHGEEQNLLLFGDAQASSNTGFRIGSLVVVTEPTWCIELDTDSWRVCIRWRVEMEREV